MSLRTNSRNRLRDGLATNPFGFNRRTPVVSTGSNRFSILSRGKKRGPFALGRPHLIGASMVLFGLLVYLCGHYLIDTDLPQPRPFPPAPRRALATMHTESNACYDMALTVFLASFLKTQSPFPMLVLHSTDLPQQAKALIESSNYRVVAIPIQERRSYFVANSRWRKCATKFSIWAQDDYDQLIYFDSDHIFEPDYDPRTPFALANDALLAGTVDSRRSKEFNGGTLLIRPSRAVYHRLADLYDKRLFLMGLYKMMSSGDQRFLNAVYAGKWTKLPSLRENVFHRKVWKEACFPSSPPDRKKKARELVDSLQLRDTLKQCLALPVAYSSAFGKEKASIELWF